MACSGGWLTGPGTPLELSHQSLEGRWVNVLVVTTLVTNPSIAYRIEYSPNEGEIVEFDGSGGVHHSRYGWDVTYTSPNYTINGDTLTMELAYVAEVSTTRLVLTLGGISGDYDSDGDQEAAVQVLTYQRGKD
jgi:hypothetical protein